MFPLYPSLYSSSLYSPPPQSQCPPALTTAVASPPPHTLTLTPPSSPTATETCLERPRAAAGRVFPRTCLPGDYIIITSHHVNTVIVLHRNIYTYRHTRREYSSSPPSSSKNYYQGGPPGVRKDILSPVPEMSYSGARVVDVTFGPPMSPSSVLSSTVTSQGGALRSGFTGRNWPSVGASGTRSMDALHHTPPQPRREAPPYRYNYRHLCLVPESEPLSILYAMS